METQNYSKKSLNIENSCADKTGTFLAASSIEGSIIIFKKKKEKKETQMQKILEIEAAHKNAIWKIKWANPEFGKIFATCGFDKKIKIWKIEKEKEYTSKNIYKTDFINSSVNSIDWIPSEFGLILSACTSSGDIIIIKNSDFYKNKQDIWNYYIQEDSHDEPINSIVWAPKVFCDSKNDFKEKNLMTKNNHNFCFFATGSCDHKIYLWKFRTKFQKSRFNENFRNFENRSEDFRNFKDFDICLIKKIDAHKDWVRDLSWSTSCYRGYYLLASASEDKTCKIWKIDLKNNKILGKEILEFPSPVWKVSWNFIGNLLAIAFTSLKGINDYQIYKENKEGIWENVTINK